MEMTYLDDSKDENSAKVWILPFCSVFLYWTLDEFMIPKRMIGASHKSCLIYGQETGHMHINDLIQNMDKFQVTELDPYCNLSHSFRGSIHLTVLSIESAQESDLIDGDISVVWIVEYSYPSHSLLPTIQP